MSNATVSSQVYIIRNHSTISAVAQGTMIVYADGTHVYARDKDGTTYNLCTPNVSNISISLNDLDDVVLTSLTNDASNKIHVLRYDQGTAKWVNDDLEINLVQINDVVLTSLAANQVLQYDGTNWVNATISGGGISKISDASDVFDYVAGTSPTANQTLVWDNTNSRWAPGNVINAFTMTDTGATNNVPVSNGTTVKLEGTAPITVVGNTGTSTFTVGINAAITDLSDTVSTYATQAAGQVLRWSGSAWANAALSTDDLTEGTAKFYSNAQVDAHLNQSGPTTGYVLSWNGSDYAWVANSGSGGSSTFAGLSDTASAVGDEHAVVHVTGSGGTTVDFSEFKIDDNSGAPLFYSTANTGSVGKATAHMQNVFSRFIYITGNSSAESAASDFGKIHVNNSAQDRMVFTSKVNSSKHYYDFEDSGDGTGVELAIHGNGNKFIFQTDGGSLTNQTMRLPSAAPGSPPNHVMRIAAGSTGTQLNMEWVAMPILTDNTVNIGGITSTSATVNICTDTTGARTTNIGGSSEFVDIVNIQPRGSGQDVVNIGAAGTEEVNITSDTGTTVTGNLDVTGNFTFFKDLGVGWGAPYWEVNRGSAFTTTTLIQQFMMSKWGVTLSSNNESIATTASSASGVDFNFMLPYPAVGAASTMAVRDDLEIILMDVGTPTATWPTTATWATCSVAINMDMHVTPTDNTTNDGDVTIIDFDGANIDIVRVATGVYKITVPKADILAASTYTTAIPADCRHFSLNIILHSFSAGHTTSGSSYLFAQSVYFPVAVK